MILKSSMNLRQHSVVIACCFSFILSILWAAPYSQGAVGIALGQEAIQIPSPQQDSDLQELLPPRFQLFERRSVYLDGKKVFSVSNADNISAKERANVISQRLQAIAQRLNGMPPQVTWQIEPESQLPVLSVNETVLMTVTKSDAQQIGVGSLKGWANELQQLVQRALTNSQRERKPAYLWQQGKYAALGFSIILAISAALYWKQRRLRRQSKRIDDSIKQSAGLDASENVLKRNIDIKQIQSWVALQRWICRIGQFGVWGGGLFLLMGLFPYTRLWRPHLLQLLGQPIKLGAVALVVYGLIRFGNVFIDRLFLFLQNSTKTQSRHSRRLALRFSTASRVTKNVVGSVLIAVGVFTGLSLIGIDLGPLLAGAGIIGLALSFASQNVLRDVINGFLILLEDQFGVGDVIVVGDVAGFVENMNLRITQLRNEEGRLITIPNSQITIVQNLSKEWSRVDLMIPVALHSDIDRALEIIQSVAEEMQRSPEWSSLILEPPMVLGVDQLNHEGATVRLWIMTQPLKQWDVAREYRRRLKITFDQANLDIGVPRQSISIQISQDVRNMLNAVKQESVNF